MTPLAAFDNTFALLAHDLLIANATDGLTPPRLPARALRRCVRSLRRAAAPRLPRSDSPRSRPPARAVVSGCSSPECERRRAGRAGLIVTGCHNRLQDPENRLHYRGEREIGSRAPHSSGEYE